MADRMPMIAMTISSSMSVKPDALLRIECFCLTIHNYWFQTMVIALEVLVNTPGEVRIVGGRSWQLVNHSVWVGKATEMNHNFFH